MQILQKAIASDPDFAGAYVEQGRAFKRLGRLEDALISVEKALRLSPEKPEALYNRACYNALLGRPAALVATDLSKAIKQIPAFRELALKDHDLDSVRNTKEIKDLFENLAE